MLDSSSFSIESKISDNNNSCTSDTVWTLPLYYEEEKILPAEPNSNNLLPIVCYVPQLFSTPRQTFLNITSNRNPSIRPNKLISPFIKNTSISIFYESDDSTNLSDEYETRRQLKKEKEKLKTPTATYKRDLAGNVNFQEKEVKFDPRAYILTRKVLPKGVYNIGNLEQGQYSQIQGVLEENSMVFAWEA
ncbi:12972_t:CDS:2 [Gigaspora rosea]|nr:12972_t:CDS:2 [Gigaspora rosea]